MQSDDAPAGRAGFERGVSAIAKAIALAMAAFQLFTAITVNFSPMVQRSVHLGFALSLLFLVTPTRPGSGRRDLVARCVAAFARPRVRNV